MYHPKLKPYLKKLDYSYTFGVHPTLELFKHRQDQVIKILVHPDAQDNDGVKEIKNLCQQFEIPCETEGKAIEKIAYKDNTYMIGIFKKYESQLDENKSHIVLEEPRNMGNLGTIIRTMVALGIYDIALIGNHADIYDPKVIRSTMGAIFQANFKSYNHISEYNAEFEKHHKLGFALDESAKNLNDYKFQSSKKYSLVMGNEGAGLKSDTLEYCDERIYIQQTGDIDSLNLAISTSIAIWELNKAINQKTEYPIA